METSGMGRQRSWAVLVVDDERIVLTLLESMLGRQGFRVLTASSGGQALDIFGRERDEIDLVITDIVMPGMDGQALADELQRLRPGLPVLFISGFPDRVGTLALPFLSKPFSSAALVGKVRSLLLPDQARAAT